MRKVKFIYNPNSGTRKIGTHLDEIIKIYQSRNLNVVPFRLDYNNKLEKSFEDVDDTYSHILIAGGDGTVDSVVNYMMKNDIDLPIAVLPTGTANDFAKALGMDQDVLKACEQILDSKPKKIDIGKVNDKFFVNVFSAGMFTAVSQKIDDDVKNSFGKLSYYVKGIGEAVQMKDYYVRIKSNEFNFEGKMFLFLVFNGRTAGNLDLAYKSQLDDGLFDVLIFESMSPATAIPLFIKLTKGEHLENGDIEQGLNFFKTDELVIECDEDLITDIDGESGPEFPVKVKCIKNRLSVLGVEHASDENK